MQPRPRPRNRHLATSQRHRQSRCLAMNHQATIQAAAMTLDQATIQAAAMTPGQAVIRAAVASTAN